MTIQKEDVIRMAREAGGTAYTNRHYPNEPAFAFSNGNLQRFAKPLTQPEKQRLWNDACHNNRSSITDAAMEFGSMVEAAHKIGVQG